MGNKKIMKKYQIIVIDPPWEIKKIRNKQRPKISQSFLN